MSRATTVLLRSSSSDFDSSSDSRFRRFSRRVPSSLSLLLCHLSLCVRVNRRVLFLTTMRACTAIVRKKEKKKKENENKDNVNTRRRGNKRVNITPKRGSHSGFEGKSRAHHEKTVTFYCSHFIPAQTSLIYLVTSTANTRSFSAFACCRSG